MNGEKRGKEVAGLEGRVLIDGFKYAHKQIEAFFLSHFHGDHYDGLSESFEGPGKIHCTRITGELVVQELKVRRELVMCYEYGESAQVCGAKVTFLDANHCPGAALLLFELEDGTTHLHTGDMRYDKKMKEYPELVRRQGTIDRVYLDTTYCHPKHVFLGQDKSIDIIASDVVNFLQGGIARDREETQSKEAGEEETSKAEDPSRRFVLLSAYKIGKERVICEVARRANKKVYVDEAKMRVMKCLRMSEEELSGWADSSNYNKKNCLQARRTMISRFSRYVDSNAVKKAFVTSMFAAGVGKVKEEREEKGWVKEEKVKEKGGKEKGRKRNREEATISEQQSAGRILGVKEEATSCSSNACDVIDLCADDSSDGGEGAKVQQAKVKEEGAAWQNNHASGLKQSRRTTGANEKKKKQQQTLSSFFSPAGG
eukprot:767004-Hanusia_phi.AAC.4